jgi:hypothetical protein
MKTYNYLKYTVDVKRKEQFSFMPMLMWCDNQLEFASYYHDKLTLDTMRFYFEYEKDKTWFTLKWSEFII